MFKVPRSLIYIFTLILFGVLLILGSACTRAPKQACFGANCFKLEIPLNEQQRAQGLMFRKKLDFDKGMLFIFEAEDIHCFWMKNTLIPLDIIWLNQYKEVVHIAKSVPPCKTESCPKICPDAPSLYTLELNAGSCDRIGLRKRDYVIIE